MKKVLILNTTLNKGGAARVAHDLYESLGSDFEMFFAYGRGKKDSDSKTFYFGNRLEMFIHIFLVRFLGIEGFGSYFSTKKLIGFIKKEKFDLIHMHNLHGYCLDFFTLIHFLKQNKISVVWTLHDEWAVSPLSAYRLGCNHCTTGTGKCLNKNNYPKTYFPLMEKRMLNQKKKVFTHNWNPSLVCPSEWLGNQIRQSYLQNLHINVVNNGIDTNLFKPSTDKQLLRAKYNLPLDKRIILFIAANFEDKRKGVSYIVEAAEILQDKNYLFIGLGKGNLQESINIKNLGYVNDKIKLAEIYSLSDVFCFTSTAETFLLTVAEAFSCGIPVLGFDIPVVRELVRNGAGILTTENTSQSLAKEINTLLDNNSKLLEMGQNGRKLIEDNYSKEKFKAGYLKVYNEILKQNE